MTRRHVPIEYWPEHTREAMRAAFAARAEATAERIREQMRHVRCSCASPAQLADDGRCSRCWGWPTPVGDADEGRREGEGREVTDRGVAGTAVPPAGLSYAPGCTCASYLPLVDIYGNERCMRCDRTRKGT